MPHFEQAKHLSPKMAAVGRSLNNDQISQLEKSLNNEYKEELAEINNNSLATSLKKDLIMMLRLIDIKLSTKQLKVLNTEVKHYHDIRHAELTAERKLDQQLISVLKSHDDPQFVPRFVSIWNNSTPRLSATNTQKQQQNRQTDAVLMQKLIMSFDTKQKQNLADKLLSISQTFSELANESN
ncbi:MAG TPA: hypothetical protein EYG68_12245 [Leucothrix mucor]|nr:hypothetical protein [Leucothrix mucor]